MISNETPPLRAAFLICESHRSRLNSKPKLGYSHKSNSQEIVMRTHGWTGVVLIVLGAMTLGPTSANALTAELAKKCIALTTYCFANRSR